MSQNISLKILSIDGGGIRGVIPCRILAHIEQQIKIRYQLQNRDNPALYNVFDLIAGTSTGGIIALGLSAKNPATQEAFTATEMQKLYTDNGGFIFQKRQSSFLYSVLSVIPSKMAKSVAQLFQKPYASTHIEEVLKEYFGETHLCDCLTDVLVTSHDIKSGRPYYYSSRLGKMREEENHALSEVARSTSAAPTFFQPNVTQDIYNQNMILVDGGVLANNPSVLAYAEAKEIYKKRKKNVQNKDYADMATKGFEPETAPDDYDLPFYMLSIGTGKIQKKLDIDTLQKSGTQTQNWLEPLLNNVFMNSTAETNDYVMHYLLPPYTDGTPRYQRINIDVPEELGEMDNPDNMPKLIALAEEYIKNNKQLFDEICNMLVR